MTDEHRDTGIGWPDTDPDKGPPQDSAGSPTPAEGPVGSPTPAEEGLAGGDPPPDGAADGVPVGAAADAIVAAAGDEPAGPAGGAGDRRVSAAGVMIILLLALLGFALVAQVRNTSTDQALASARQEDLVRILSDLESSEERLRENIAELEESRRQLNSGVEGRQAALAEARRRADELGILAGALPARGPGLVINITQGKQPIKARALLDAVQELRGAGAEAMQVAGGDGVQVRLVTTSYFADRNGGVAVDGQLLSAPFTLTVIGDPETMRTALNIPGGVVETVGKDGGTVTVQEPGEVDVSALRAQTAPRYAKPVS